MSSCQVERKQFRIACCVVLVLLAGAEMLFISAIIAAGQMGASALTTSYVYAGLAWIDFLCVLIVGVLLVRGKLR